MNMYASERGLSVALPSSQHRGACNLVFADGVC
jgi:prepilin-type processing-associated H-X9-DG protein